ncbi:methionyl-tRNA formyltransferase [Virgibacillus sp. W0430]|uniref:methionyl-tRNA formyltransferase n=1 Tax=Virgibacillus sp. W0430 TaxID=3391580 RepID=UPI003F46D6FB
MINKFKIGYFADGIWAHRALELLLDDKRLQICFICVRYDSEDIILKDYAQRHKIDYLKHEDINSNDFLALVEKYNCDLFVSMSFNQIMKRDIINMPPYKTINCHAGKLPFYRGRNVLNWVLINGESEFGITVHFIDEGIDTGDIILQKTYPIKETDDYRSLLNLAYTECGKLLYDAINLIQNENVTVTKQKDIHPVGFYCGKRKVGDEIIDWNQSSEDLFNFIRAICYPGPKSRSLLRDKEIKINKSRIIPNAIEYKGIPGQVIGKTNNGFIIKTKDTFLEIIDYEYDGQIRIGDRLIKYNTNNLS